MDVTLETEEGGESSPNSHQNERDPEHVQGLDCMVEGRLIKIDWYYLYEQDASSF